MKETAERATLSRRAFVGRSVAGIAMTALGAAGLGALGGARRAMAQGVAGQGTLPPASDAGLDSSNLFAMDQSASRTVRRPPKPGARPQLTAAERDALEHRLRCQCGCTLDVYTCRTTDFSCQVSPAMHADVMALVEGGYGAEEIIDAFASTYGEKVLMSPTTEGFNLVGWVAPFAAVGIGGAVVAMLLARWRRTAAARGPAAGVAPAGARPSPGFAKPLARATPAAVVEATDDELARLARIVRDDS